MADMKSLEASLALVGISYRDPLNIWKSIDLSAEVRKTLADHRASVFTESPEYGFVLDTIINYAAFRHRSSRDVSLENSLVHPVRCVYNYLKMRNPPPHEDLLTDLRIYIEIMRHDTVEEQRPKPGAARGIVANDRAMLVQVFRSAGYDKYVLTGIIDKTTVVNKLLTREQGEPYDEYIHRLLNDETVDSETKKIAIIAKASDTADNAEFDNTKTATSFPLERRAKRLVKAELFAKKAVVLVKQKCRSSDSQWLHQTAQRSMKNLLDQYRGVIADEQRSVESVRPSSLYAGLDLPPLLVLIGARPMSSNEYAGLLSRLKTDFNTIQV